MNGLAALLAESVPAFSDQSPNLYVRFAVRPFRNARVAWLNRRWFLSKGVDCGCDRQRHALEMWLIDRFGVAAPLEDDPADQYRSEERHLYADRYGAPSGSPHGGSGRVGTFGAFNAKGIGRTPLVSAKSDWYHSHGCMFLEEAVREAVISEVSAAAFPYGAVPTIAVIDTGARLRWRDGSFGARRAIAVRPSFLRIASLMRTIYFGTSGSAHSDQALDAARVRELWQGVAAADVSDALYRVGAQYGFGNALRLWPGPMFPSNFTFQGELVDFGSFRALPSWRRAQGSSRAHSFGGEASLAAASARSLARNGLRCGVALDPAELTARFHEGFRTGFSRALTRYGIGADTPLARKVEETRAKQQRVVTDLSGGDGESATIGGLVPWEALYREELLAQTEAMIDALEEGPGGDLAPIGTFIDRYIDACDPSAQSC